MISLAGTLLIATVLASVRLRGACYIALVERPNSNNKMAPILRRISPESTTIEFLSFRTAGLSRVPTQLIAELPETH
jgi:hypothetical protein